jgi:DNA-binding transcriptional ArsR family regulator
MAQLEDNPGGRDLIWLLNNSLRRAVLRLMVEQKVKSTSPKEAALELRVPLSNVSYHVKQLLDSGAIELVDAVPTRGSTEHFYRPTDRVMREPWAMVALAVESDS